MLCIAEIVSAQALPTENPQLIHKPAHNLCNILSGASVLMVISEYKLTNSGGFVL